MYVYFNVSCEPTSKRTLNSSGTECRIVAVVALIMITIPKPCLRSFMRIQLANSYRFSDHKVPLRQYRTLHGNYVSEVVVLVTKIYKIKPS